MRASWAGVPLARRGLSEAWKRTSRPLFIRTTISPRSKLARIGLSAKMLEVLIPSLYDEFPVLFRKLFGPRQILDL